MRRLNAICKTASPVKELARALDEIKRLRQKPWCHTCGTTVDEVLCPKCTKWWNDNTPPIDKPAQSGEVSDDIIGLQWNAGWKTWEQVSPEYLYCEGIVRWVRETDYRALTERLRVAEEALRVLRDLPIVENNNPDALHLDGVVHTGPAVDYLFRIVRKVKEVARAALERKD